MYNESFVFYTFQLIPFGYWMNDFKIRILQYESYSSPNVCSLRPFKQIYFMTLIQALNKPNTCIKVLSLLLKCVLEHFKYLLDSMIF